MTSPSPPSAPRSVRQAPRSRLPVWPYYFLAIAIGLAGGAMVYSWWPAGYPGEDDLVKVSGEIIKVVVRDDISDSSAGAFMPALTAVYFTMKGIEGEFRYPSSHPKYVMVRDFTAVAMDVWVEQAEIGTGRPLTIWAIEERNPYNLVMEATSIGYGDIVGELAETDRSRVEAGGWLLAIAAALLATGFLVQRRNRGLPSLGP